MDVASGQNLFEKIKGELSPKFLLPTLMAGSIVALFEIVLAVSFAALIFAGPLAPFVASGIGLALFGTVVMAVVTTLLVSLPGTISGNQDAPAAVLAVIAAAIAGRVTADAESVFVTVVTAVALTTLCTGLIFLGLGTFKAGRWVRFLPFPVTGGFLGGTGWLLLAGSLSLMTDLPVAVPGMAILLQPDVLVRWLPGLFVALALFFATRRFDHFLLMPGMILGGIVLFYLVVWLTGVSPEAVADAGWLLGPFPDQSLWLPLTSLDFGKVDWGAIGSQTGSILTILIISTVSLLLIAGGLELSTAEDVDLNRELRAAGLGNLLASFGGGLVGFQQLSLSVLNMKMGVSNRLAGLVAAGLCAVVLFQGAAVLAIVPKVVLGGLLLYLGISFLYEWVVESWFKLPKADALIIVLIVVVIAAVGFLQGVLLGLVAAVILFGVNYGRTNVVHHELSGRHMRSRVTRSAAERQTLQSLSDQIHVWQLQGYIFFGTADTLLSLIRSRVIAEDKAGVTFVVLDFQRVTGLDSTAVFSFQKLQQVADKHQLTVVLTGLLTQFQRQLQNAMGENGRGQWFTTLDEGLEWCEDALLQPTAAAEPSLATLKEQLQLLLPDGRVVDGLLPYLTRHEVQAGDVLMTQGSAPDSLFFVESGQVTAQLERPSHEPVRLETMGQGRVVGEMGFYLGQARTASVVADKRGVVYELSRQKLAQMEAEAPEAAAGLHRLIAYLLAERATHLVETVEALQR
ncbi:MAG: cyclic nucleotide-binding domain-containing protein [Ardenticatenaceae bacterium]|nr:cyclic nucleotide-binding domain-containing protein [Ardenticatenaceae bacterium]